MIPKAEEPEGQPDSAALSPAERLYDKCAEAAPGTVFFQRDLSNFKIAENVGELLTLLQELCDRHLMKLMTLDGEPCWKLRARSDADKYVQIGALDPLFSNKVQGSADSRLTNGSSTTTSIRSRPKASGPKPCA